MELFKYIRISILQVTSLICFVGFLLGVLNLHFSDKTNYCEMTYMYEYPQFVRIHFNDTNDYPAYGLYAYSEGRWTEKARKLRFDGIPVLFLPGNAGSHMQARSLASVALRKALSKGFDFHFDYFTISYNEELTGLYGGTLIPQAVFAVKSINKILDLYSANKFTKHVPKQVILIGHSMGGVLASRLLSYPGTDDTTKIAITLAAPLEAPALIIDRYTDSFYRHMKNDWRMSADYYESDMSKVLISFASGPRDVLVPSSLSSFNYSFITALTTAVPGSWVSPDHVSIVWCKQMVMAINRYLFSLVDPQKLQIVDNIEIIKENAKHFFVANRGITLDTSSPLKNVTMVADAFWYEDNRRNYQVSRPGIEKMTYLMIRLVGFPQNRFVAIQAVNVENQDWVYGCNAKHTYNVHRYCKQAASLSKLTRWTGAANKFGKRKLATIHLHDLKKQHQDWTHVIVKVSPTKKPITLNVDINDLASRQIEVTLPSVLFSLDKKRTVIQQTQDETLYYELILKGFSALPEAYLLYVEPTMSCKEYHVSAEVHVPWAENHEYFHYFTHLKRSPMKIRLFKTNPNSTKGEPLTEHVTVTLLLDPRCSFTVSISASWYHSLGQLVRNYTSLLIPYIVGIVIMAAASNIFCLWDTGCCESIHSSMDSELMKPYYVMWMAKLLFIIILNNTYLWFVLDYSSYGNSELQWLIRSFLVFPAYMVALGLLNVAMAVFLCAMVFSSQLDRLLFRIFWGSDTTLGERLAHAVRKVPVVLSAVMVAAVPMSCGAASLAIGAAFYAYLISRKFQDYFEDLLYKLGAKVASKLCRLIKKQPKKTNSKGEEIKWRNLNEMEKEGLKSTQRTYTHKARDEDLSNMNFHMMMFSIWMISLLLNMPTLLAWARNYKYSGRLPKDPSFDAGFILSACSSYIWQINGPRKYLKYYEKLSIFIYLIGIVVILVGPFSLWVPNYALIVIFSTITVQQMIDYEQTIIDKRTYDDLYGMNEEDEREENERFISNRRNKLEVRKKINRRIFARNWNYFGQLASGARQRVGNIINRGNTGNETSATENSTGVRCQSCFGIRDKDQDSLDDNITPLDKYDDEEIIVNETESNVDETKYHEEVKSDEAGNINEGNETTTNNAGSSENCDPCDENTIYTAFKNLREKLSFNE